MAPQPETIVCRARSRSQFVVQTDPSPKPSAEAAVWIPGPFDHRLGVHKAAGPSQNARFLDVSSGGRC